MFIYWVFYITAACKTYLEAITLYLGVGMTYRLIVMLTTLPFSFFLFQFTIAHSLSTFRAVLLHSDHNQHDSDGSNEDGEGNGSGKTDDQGGRGVTQLLTRSPNGNASVH